MMRTAGGTLLISIRDPHRRHSVEFTYLHFKRDELSLGTGGGSPLERGSWKREGSEFPK
jgi:hypothetical protein